MTATSSPTRNTTRRMSALFAATAISLTAAQIAGAEGARTVPDVEWNTPLAHFQMDSDKHLGQRLTFDCPPRHVTDEDDALYGSGAYPSDSPLCVAAVHAGAVTADGGRVTAQLNPGLESYAGSFANGVESRDRPGTERSIVFLGATDLAAADEIQRTYAQRLSWDDKFTRTGLANMDLVGQQFTFDCPEAPADMRSRRVVGTDSYAFDSMICRAAVHAGVIGFDGGLVRLQLDPRISDLPGSIRNGVETAGGSSGVRSISFVDLSVLTDEGEAAGAEPGAGAENPDEEPTDAAPSR